MKSRAHITSSYPSSGEIQVNGKVGGASSDLYRSEDTNISVNFAPILTVPVLVAGAGETSNFRRTDVELAALDIKALGFGAGLAATFTTKNAFEINLDFSAILGAEITLTFGEDGNWLLPTFSGNTYATVESSLGVGALGMGVGYSAGVRYDEGMLTTSGYAEFGLMSVSAFRRRLATSRRSGGKSGGFLAQAVAASGMADISRRAPVFVSKKWILSASAVKCRICPGW